MGKLVPLNWFESLPGDVTQQSTSVLLRLAPILAPLMHPINVSIYHFFVPNRLIWEDFEEYITGGEDGNYTCDHPVIAPSSVAEGSLLHHLGIPAATYSSAIDFNALPVRAYQLIFNEYFRDQDLTDEVDIVTSSGTDTTTSTSLRSAPHQKDYFTAARPYTQKGDDVTIPLSADDAPVKGIGTYDQTYNSSGTAYETGNTAGTSYTSAKVIGNNTGSNASFLRIEEDPDNTGFPAIYAELSQITGMSIDDWRLGIAVQRFKERMTRFGSRYGEYLKSLGVKCSDARLQQPELLGRGRTTIQISEVLSTDGSNTGDLYGHGIAAMRTNRYRRYFEEHGIVMTLMKVMPKPIYASGIYRGWLRTTKETYHQPELEHIGEQAITNKEVYSEHSQPDNIFGYQFRYNEYRELPSIISGEFCSTLNHWTLARIFDSDVALNTSFVYANPTKRIFASSETDGLYIMANNNIQSLRKMSPLGRSKTF
jgi:hypothetical protein